MDHHEAHGGPGDLSSAPDADPSGDLGEAHRGELVGLHHAHDEAGGLRKQDPTGLDAVRVVEPVGIRGGAQVAGTPIRFIMSHCWVMERRLFQVQ